VPAWNGWDTHQADFATRRGCHPSSPAPASSERLPKARVQLQSREGDAETLQMPARLCQLQRDVEHRLEVPLRGLQSIMVGGRRITLGVGQGVLHELLQGIESLRGVSGFGTPRSRTSMKTHPSPNSTAGARAGATLRIWSKSTSRFS
jgi:hypothetical protein